MYAALKKYGWEAFETIILDYTTDQNQLNKLEEFYIQKYNSMAPNGYNTKIISEGRGKQAESTKKKMSLKRLEYLKIHGPTPFGPSKNLHKHINGVECKQCTTCNIWKELISFGAYADTWDKLNRKCKDCHNKYRRQYKYEGLSNEDWKKSYLNRQKKKASVMPRLYKLIF